MINDVPNTELRCWSVDVSRSIGDISCLWVEQNLIFDSGLSPALNIWKVEKTFRKVRYLSVFAFALVEDVSDPVTCIRGYSSKIQTLGNGTASAGSGCRKNGRFAWISTSSVRTITGFDCTELHRLLHMYIQYRHDRAICGA